MASDDSRPAADPQPAQDETPAKTFRDVADDATPGLLAEFWEFLVHEKKWWLVPLLLALLLLFAVAWFGGSAAGPFIYPGL